MTPLKPIENRHVRAVAAERYPINAVCAHPDCKEPAVDPHHTFPRSQIAGDSWFVEITYMSDEDGNTSERTGVAQVVTIPHVTGLCREHHDAVESHASWIKLEDGVFVWYDLGAGTYGDLVEAEESGEDVWTEVGALNPQPGSQVGRPKRSRFKGEARRKRATISIKVPQDEQEDGAGVWDDTLERVSEKLGRLLGFPEGDERPVYNQLVDAMNDWLTIPDKVSLDGE